MSLAGLGLAPQEALNDPNDVALPTMPASANITHWFRAAKGAFSDAGITPATDTDGVHLWKNFGREPDDPAIQATGANQPTFRTGGQNGRPYLDCGATTDAIFFGNLSPSHNGGITSLPAMRTYAFVIDPVNLTDVNNPLTGGNGGLGGKLDIYLRPSAGNVRFFKSQIALGSVAQPMIVVCSVASTTSFRIVVNGTYATQSNSNNASSADPTSLQFLRNTWSSLAPDNYFGGKIYEAILWGSGQVLSQAQMEQVSDLLNDFYAIY